MTCIEKIEYRFRRGQIFKDNKVKLRIATDELKHVNDTLQRVVSTVYAGYELTDTSEVKGKIEVLNDRISKITYYDVLDDYAKAHGRSNPIVIENMERMKNYRYATPDKIYQMKS